MTDPSLLPSLDTIQKTQTFTDERTKESWTFTFEMQAGYAPVVFLRDKTNELIAKFGGDGGEPVKAGKYRIPVSPTLCNDIATILMMDVSDYGDSAKWNFRHWAVLSQTCPDVFLEVCDLVSDILTEAGGDAIDEDTQQVSLKNDLAADEDISLVPPLTTDISTPTL